MCWDSGLVLLLSTVEVDDAVDVDLDDPMLGSARGLWWRDLSLILFTVNAAGPRLVREPFPEFGRKLTAIPPGESLACQFTK